MHRYNDLLSVRYKTLILTEAIILCIEGWVGGREKEGLTMPCPSRIPHRTPCNPYTLLYVLITSNYQQQIGVNIVYSH